MSAEHLIVVRNPNSTNAKRVEAEVLRPLKDENIRFETYETVADTKANIDAMASFPEDAKVISAAGDGTASQLANARLQSESEFTVGFLPYGNFNDLASAHMKPSQSVLDLVNAPTVERSALAIDVNGDHWRYAPGYATFGLTARIAAGYDNEASRLEMQSASRGRRLAKRLGQAFSDYLRYKEEKIASYAVDGGAVQADATDIAIANNPVAAGMIRQREPFYNQPYFGAEQGVNLNNLFDTVRFGSLSAVGLSPLKRLQTMHIAFEQVADVHAQTEGEYELLRDVRDIFIYKHPRNTFDVLHARKG